MFIEVLVALSLFGIVLAAVAEAHQTVAKLTSSANEREDREKALLYEHFKNHSPLSNCSSAIIIPEIVNEVCCDLEVTVGQGQKSSRACKLFADTGSALLSFILASFFLVLLTTISYPTIKQLMIEKKVLKDSHSQKLSLAETESELQRGLFDNQALRLPGITRVLSRTDLIVKPVLELANASFRPHNDTSFLLSSELNLKYLALPEAKSISTSSTVKFLTCGKFLKDTSLLAGFYLGRWEFFQLASINPVGLPRCSTGSIVTLRKLDGGNRSPNEQLFGLAPIKQSELYYLDNNNSLRRYSLVQRRTTPVDYGYSKFRVDQIGNLFSFQLTKLDKQKERDFLFEIALEATNTEVFYSLLL